MANAKQPPKDRRSRPAVSVAPPVAAPQPEPVTSGEPSAAEQRIARAMARTEQEAEARLSQIYLQNEIMERESLRIYASGRLARASALAEKGRTFMFGAFGVAALAFALAVLTGGAP